MKQTLENRQLLHRTDSIVLRPQPVIRIPKSKELRIVLQVGPLTVTEVKTVKGEIAHMFEARSKKYAYPEDFKKIAAKMFRLAFPNSKEKVRAKARRYYRRHKKSENIRSARYYKEHRAILKQ